jgi:hypothetical protein
MNRPDFDDIPVTLEDWNQRAEAEAEVRVQEMLADDAPRRPTSATTFPEEAFVGSIGDFARVMSANTEVPPEFYFACGLTMVGAIANTRLTINLSFDVEPRLYTVLLGGSYEVKKSTALKKSMAFFETLRGEAELPSICYGVGSAEGLISELNHAPNGKVIITYDELRALVDKCNIKGSTLLAAITSLFEQNKIGNRIQNAKKSSRCENGHLSVLGCCTTETYKHIWSPGAIAIGLVNRLFVVLADVQPKQAVPLPPDAAALDAVRGRLVEQLRRLPITYDFTRLGKEHWTEWIHTPRISEHARRLDTIGYRLLVLMALTMDRTEIDEDVVDVVVRMLDYEFAVRILTDPIDADSIVAGLEEDIRRKLRVKGPMVYNDIRRAVNADRKGIWAFENAVKNLKSVGDIQSSRDGRYSLIVRGQMSSS